jgi:uncharacterized protein YdeI (YjbR/CyaY-like superfamily)
MNFEKHVEAESRQAWRAWLRAHHASEDHVWLVFYKQHTGIHSVDYEASVQEALCFGWIDSIIKRLDDSRYMRKFTPRKSGSDWSSSNLRRFAALVKAKQVRQAGLAVGPSVTQSQGRAEKRTADWANRVPPYIRDAFRGEPSVWRQFTDLAPSYRRLYVGWIHSAKREETRRARIEEARRRLARGEKLGLK